MKVWLKRRWLSLLALLIGLVFVPVLYLFWSISVHFGFLGLGFQPFEMTLAQYTPKDVIGNLGGMTVKIPRHYAEFVTYDGDPGWGEKREGPIPERTFDSTLRSFGMDVRFPDMKGLENWEMREEKRQIPLSEDPWLYVGISSGERYPGDGFLDRLSSVLLDVNHFSREHWWNNHHRQPEDAYGLEVYVVMGNDPRTGKPARDSDSTNDYYLKRDASGKVKTHIRCGRTSVPGGVANCDLVFSLEPKAQVDINVSFRRGLLPQWHAIQKSMRTLLLSFEVLPQPQKAAPAAAAQTLLPMQSSFGQ